MSQEQVDAEEIFQRIQRTMLQVEAEDGGSDSDPDDAEEMVEGDQSPKEVKGEDEKGNLGEKEVEGKTEGKLEETTDQSRSVELRRGY